MVSRLCCQELVAILLDPTGVHIFIRFAPLALSLSSCSIALVPYHNCSKPKKTNTQHHNHNTFYHESPAHHIRSPSASQRLPCRTRHQGKHYSIYPLLLLCWFCVGFGLSSHVLTRRVQRPTSNVQRPTSYFLLPTSIIHHHNLHSRRNSVASFLSPPTSRINSICMILLRTRTSLKM